MEHTAASAVTPLTTAAVEAASVRCVVCHAARDDLVQRRSGLKCPDCIGTATNGRFRVLPTRPRRRRASLDDTLSSGAVAADRESLSQRPPQLSHTASSFSNAAATEEASETAAATTTTTTANSDNNDKSASRNATRRPIEEYISGTSIFRAAVHFARHRKRSSASHDTQSSSLRNDTDGGGGVEDGTLSSWATQSPANADTVAPDVGEGSPAASPAEGVASPQRRHDGDGATPPAVPRSRGSGGDAGAASLRTPADTEDDGEMRSYTWHSSGSAGERPPLRLPRRLAQRLSVDGRPLSSPPTAKAGEEEEEEETEGEGGGDCATPPPPQPPAVTVAASPPAVVTVVRCADADGDGDVRHDQAAAPLECSADPYASPPGTPRDGDTVSVCSTVGALRATAAPVHAATLSRSTLGPHRERSPSLSTSTDVTAYPLAPRAGSRAPSCASSVSRGRGRAQQARSTASAVSAARVRTASSATHASTARTATERSTATTAAAAPTRPKRGVKGGRDGGKASVTGGRAAEGDDTAASLSALSPSSSSSSSSSSARSSASSSSLHEEEPQATAAGFLAEATPPPPPPPPVPAVVPNLDAVRLCVEIPQSSPPPPAASPHVSAGSARSEAGQDRRSQSARSSANSSCISTPRVHDHYARHVGVDGAFTVTRHTRQRSSGDALAAAGELAGAAATPRARRRRHVAADSAATGGQTEVKKLSLSLVVCDRHSGAVLWRQERRLYQQIIPALDRMRSSGGSGLPPGPSRRLPSLRFATDVFAEERRAEVAAFLRAVEQSPFHMRHPDLLQLLGLEANSTGGATAIGAGPASHRACSGGGGGRSLADSVGPRAGGRPRGVAAVPGVSTSPPTPAVSGGAAAAVSTAYLNSEALDALRGGDGGPLAVQDRFRRTPSQASVRTSRSSVVRRHKLDDVTMEDLENIQLGNIIGRGSFGSVYLGLLQTRRGPLMVAVKVMTVGDALPAEELESQQRELDVLCAARHKNIIRFLGSSLDTTTRDLRVFTEYVECGTIRSLVERFGALTLLAIQQYMRQILNGLQYLHSLSIAHRDIKGENILVTKHGRVKLSDFGSSTGTPATAAAMAAAAAADATSEAGSGSFTGGAEMPVGSPQYMAPEVIQGAVESATAADIWSLGCVGIEMLDRPIWTAKPSMNPFVFLFRISQAGTPPQGLPTEAELGAVAQGERAGDYAGLKVYRDFLLSCCQVDAAKRPSAAELLRHPFLSHPYAKHLRWLPPQAEKK